MLNRLAIENVVLIEACELDFTPGLCVLTGETGAGKSILLDALGLALGARGEAGLIRRGAAQASVTAEFDVARNEEARALLAELDIEPEDTLIIRRSVSEGGKSRALVNDRPVSVSALKRLGSALLEIHGQHDQRGLMDASAHRALLDAYGRHAALLEEVRARHRAWGEAKSVLAALEEELAQSRREEEYLRHMAAELAKLAPAPGEEESLAEARALMMQSEKLFATLSDALGELQSGKGVSLTIRAAARLLSRSPLATDGRFTEVLDALERAATEVDEAESALESLGKASAFDPARLEASEERLFALRAAARKYQVSPDALAALREDAESRLSRLTSREKALTEAQRAIGETRAAYAESAAGLSAARARAGAELAQAVNRELAPLKMGGTRFRVAVAALPEEAWSAAGADSVSFEAAINVSAGTPDEALPFAPIAKIASGGELSRFMLAMKVAMREVRSAPTLIFDEIDTGTGGAVADAIGKRLAELGETAQVLVVTHLPQVAARGSQHLRVSKEEGPAGVFTSVRPLPAQERKEELARMLAGESVTPEARKAAQKLLELAG